MLVISSSTIAFLLLSSDAAGGRKRGRKPARPAEVEADIPPLMALVNKDLEVLGFNQRHRKSFQNQVMRYGLPHTMSFDWYVHVLLLLDL